MAEGAKRRKVLEPVCVAAGLAVGLLFAPTAAAAPFDCVTNNCGIIHDAPLWDLVVGTIDGIATPQQSAALLAAAQKRGLWKVFPADPGVFTSKIQAVSVVVAPGRSVTILTSVEQSRISRFKIGDLARFAPHRNIHEKPRPGDPYWVGIGCIVVLCDPVMGEQCASGFQSGLFRVSDGVQVNFQGQKVAGGTVIDTISIRPKFVVGGVKPGA